MQAEVPPQMMLIEAVGDRHLAGEALHHAAFLGIGAGAAFLRQQHRGFIGLGGDVLEHLEVPGLGHGALETDALHLQERVETHHAHADAALSRS